MKYDKYKSVYEIDFEKYYSEGYRAVMFDIDNTLVPNQAPADERAISLFNKLKRIGFKTLLLSNNHSEDRVRTFANVVGADWYQDSSAKPLKVGYEMGLKLLQVDKKEAIFIGDQIFTDFIGGMGAGIFTILTSPLDKKSDGVFEKNKRLLEKPIRGFMNIKKNREKY